MIPSPIRHALLAAVLLSCGAAFAQDASEPTDPHAAHGTAPMAADLPAACGAPEPKAGAMAPGMEMEMEMEGAMSGDPTPVQAANRAAMALMHGPMTQAAMIEDADLAFNCGMIAHHRGAIAMARVELEHGKDAASRARADKVIAAQEKEIAEMTAWVEANGR